MLQTILMTFAAVVIAIGGGGLSAWYALDLTDRLDTLRVGVWVAYPSEGTLNADPYAKARTARNGELPLGAAEGIKFIAREDSSGSSLRRNCTYLIDGRLPVARIWTLYAAAGALAPLDPGSELVKALSSQTILYENDGSVAILTAPTPQPGNWLAYDGQGALALVLTLYDTPIAANSSIAEIVLPEITRVNCDN